MKTFQIFSVALVAFLHIYFLILEMFYWAKPKGLKAFGISKEFANQSRTLAANQGLYNGFLAAGLIWSMVNNSFGKEIAIFFLSFVVLAGIFGAITTKKIKLFYIQSVPAIFGIVLTLLVE